MKIFKKKMPIELLFDFFDKVKCEPEKKYIIDKTFFKKFQLYNLLQPLLDVCKEYYLESQKKYLLKKPFLYKSFNTIVRQICRINDIPFYYKIIYFHSEYEIVYYINYTQPQEE